MTETKEKRYVSDNAQLMAEWDWEKNTELGYDPQKIVCGSGVKAWWKCHKGHEWFAKITDRKNHGCPYCSGRKAILGVNDLATLFPELVKEWFFEKNNTMPSEYKANSHKKVWWKCDKGHSWESIIKNRTNGHGCPYCAEKKAFPGENDLITKHPFLSQEWHREKNPQTTPFGVACYSNQKVWWLGICGHEWQDTPGHRVMGRGCPTCNRQNKTSFPEQAIYYYFSQIFSDAVNGYTKIFPGAMELDVYIPSLQIGIEYDGRAWHNSDKALSREKEKFKICKENGIRLIRIKEKASESDAQTCDDLIYCDSELNLTIKKLLDLCGIETEINVDKDRVLILEGYLSRKRLNSFEANFPKESREWHPKLNGTLMPCMFSCGSSEKVWWVCSKGHEWQMPINQRAQGNGCPYCSNHRVSYGYNDLLTTNSALVEEWHTIKNLPLTPAEILSTSTYRAWWICSKGHEWQATVHDRARGRGCPYCSNKKVLAGYNDLMTINPILCIEWNYEKNGEVVPTGVTAGSSKKVWWNCNVCGFIWRAKIMNRHRGSGCPECAKLKRIQILNPKK